MSRIIYLIDGFNLYHALDYRREYRKYKWVNLAKLSQCFVTDKKDSLEAAYYFTALATWDPGKAAEDHPRISNWCKFLTDKKDCRIT